MTRAEMIHRRREIVAWAQTLAALAFAFALTFLGWAIVHAQQMRDEDADRRLELRREIRQLIREADEVRGDSPAKGLADYGKMIGFVLLAATEEA